MQYNVYKEVLLEIASSMSGKWDLQQLLKNCLPKFMRKLDCTAATVVNTMDGFRIELVMPKIIASCPDFHRVVQELSREMNVQEARDWLSLERGGSLYYGFRLEGFGLLILARSRPLDKFFAQELLSVVQMLARTCLACLEVEKRKRSEQEREKLQAQLAQAQKMESIGILAGGIAHDFNNLLHAMGGNLELLDMKIPDDHPGKKRVKTIQKSMDRAAHLVRQMLLFSRKADIRTQVLDLNQEIHNAAILLEQSIPRMISIELILDENAWSINADPIQVDQVLLNLGTNAADAMPDGGRLIIETANAALDQDFVRIHTGAKPGKYVLMTVSDTGFGMDKKTRDQVFDPFFTTKEVGKGTGLGLASTYGIVKAHEGYILCYSEPGQGTAFKIYWPAAEQGEIEPGEIQTDQAVSQDGTETILVVDDDDQIRELTSEVLEDSGYQVISASSGEQALEVFRKKYRDIDLVLMDLNMPGMGGSQCTRKMMILDPSVRVLVASGYSANGHGKAALEFGAKGFISKPFQVDQLLAKVRQVLDNQVNHRDNTGRKQ